MRDVLPKDCTAIISGGAQGIDSYAEKLAAQLNIAFEKYEPDYGAYGKKAPLIRNVEIVNRADKVLAFWDFHSRGTAHTIALCIKHRVPVRIFRL
jgi:hypothetical protein